MRHNDNQKRSKLNKFELGQYLTKSDDQNQTVALALPLLVSTWTAADLGKSDLNIVRKCGTGRISVEHHIQMVMCIYALKEKSFFKKIQSRKPQCCLNGNRQECDRAAFIKDQTANIVLIHLEEVLLHSKMMIVLNKRIQNMF